MKSFVFIASPLTLIKLCTGELTAFHITVLNLHHLSAELNLIDPFNTKRHPWQIGILPSPSWNSFTMANIFFLRFFFVAVKMNNGLLCFDAIQDLQRWSEYVQ